MRAHNLGFILPATLPGESILTAILGGQAQKKVIKAQAKQTQLELKAAAAAQAAQIEQSARTQKMLLTALIGVGAITLAGLLIWSARK